MTQRPSWFLAAVVGLLLFAAVLCFAFSIARCWVSAFTAPLLVL